jgi:hypothetical protein
MKNAMIKFFRMELNRPLMIIKMNLFNAMMSSKLPKQTLSHRYRPQKHLPPSATRGLSQKVNQLFPRSSQK